MAGLQLGEGEGPPIDQQTEAVASSQRRLNERVSPISQTSDDQITRRHKNQRLVVLNITGPGREHRPRSALGVGVRLLRCVESMDDVYGLRAQLEHAGVPEAMYVLPTHAPVPLFVEGPPTDETQCNERVASVSKSLSTYWDHVDRDFKQHFDEREPRVEDVADIADEKAVGPVPEVSSVPLITRSPTEESTRSSCPPHHAFFSVAFVPEVKEGSVQKLYTEPLLAVFGSFATEQEAEMYTLEICDNYPRLEPCVVQGGEWLYPRLLGDAGADSLRTIFPNAAKLERLVDSLQRSAKKTASDVTRRDPI